MDAFQTLADPTRRLVVEALRNGEKPFNDIVSQARIHQSASLGIYASSRMQVSSRCDRTGSAASIP